MIDAFAYLTWPALAAPVIAPALGGLLTTYASWRWIFVINLPLGVAALLVTIRIVPNLPHADRTRMDWQGFALTGVGLGALVTSLELVSARTVDCVYVGTTGAVALITITLAVRHLRRTVHPLVQLESLRIPTFRVTARRDAIYAPSFSRDIDQPIAGSIPIDPEVRLVISEGNYLLLPNEPWPAVAHELKETWFCSIPKPVRVTSPEVV